MTVYSTTEEINDEGCVSSWFDGRWKHRFKVRTPLFGYALFSKIKKNDKQFHLIGFRCEEFC
jgi:hypothetical protein